jgi:alpha-aminoadipic semialdehyde synthase
MRTHNIGIRREDKNPWERRAPLVPAHVRALIRHEGLHVAVQPSDTRVFSDHEYAREGAEISESLSGCKVILAIKEIPEETIAPGKAYIFFSHTVKGQEYNRPMLKRLAESGCTLIDYERICDDAGRRLLFFGIQAGQAGMVETLAALGRRLESQGMASPFAALEQPYRYGSLVEIREVIRKIGWNIHEQGLDPGLVPFVGGFLGYGRTSQGAQEIYDLLPVEEIPAEGLTRFVESGDFSAHKVYKVVFKEEHLVEPLAEGERFDLQDYYDRPQGYRPVFFRHLPHFSLLVNCIYWEERFPRFITSSAMRDLFSQDTDPRLRVIGDISCDVGGSVEFTRKVTTPDQPVFVYDPLTDDIRDGHSGRGIVVMSIDNLPAEIPLESSVYFSEALNSFVPSLARADYDSGFEDCSLPPEIRRAVILYRGGFTPAYEYMREFIS